MQKSEGFFLRGFCPRVFPRGFCPGGFVRRGFCPPTITTGASEESAPRLTAFCHEFHVTQEPSSNTEEQTKYRTKYEYYTSRPITQKDLSHSEV